MSKIMNIVNIINLLKPDWYDEFIPFTISNWFFFFLQAQANSKMNTIANNRINIDFDEKLYPNMLNKTKAKTIINNPSIILSVIIVPKI